MFSYILKGVILEIIKFEQHNKNIYEFIAKMEFKGQELFLN